MTLGLLFLLAVAGLLVYLGYRLLSSRTVEEEPRFEPRILSEKARYREDYNAVPPLAPYPPVRPTPPAYANRAPAAYIVHEGQTYYPHPNGGYTDSSGSFVQGALVGVLGAMAFDSLSHRNRGSLDDDSVRDSYTRTTYEDVPASPVYDTPAPRYDSDGDLSRTTYTPDPAPRDADMDLSRTPDRAPQSDLDADLSTSRASDRDTTVDDIPADRDTSADTAASADRDTSADTAAPTDRDTSADTAASADRDTSADDNDDNAAQDNDSDTSSDS